MAAPSCDYYDEYEWSDARPHPVVDVRVVDESLHYICFWLEICLNSQV